MSSSARPDATLPQTDTFVPLDADHPVFFVGLTQTPVARTVAFTRDGNLLTSVRTFAMLGSKVLFLDSTGDRLAVSARSRPRTSTSGPASRRPSRHPVLAHVSDADAPTVLVRQTRLTDVSR